jgi:hypothetical protein
MTVDKELLELLGVDADALLPAGTTSPPKVAQAFVGKDLAGLLALPALWAPVGALPVSRHETFLAFEAEGPVEVLRGEVTVVDGLAGIETRGRRVVLRLTDGDHHTWVIDARDGTVDTYTLADPLADLPDLDPPSAPLGAPPVADWCASAQAEPWLTRAVVVTAASPDSVDHLAAVGLLVRLWTSAEGAGVPPRAAARAWLATLGEEEITLLEDDAVRRAWALSARIRRVAELPSELAAREVTAIVTARDDLASVRRVLRMARHGDHLTDALVTVDHTAMEHMSALSGLLPALADEPDADRWYAVAWQEPAAWWAGA